MNPGKRNSSKDISRAISGHNQPSKNQLTTSPTDGPKPWRFSFKYFKQMADFGVAGEGPRWFVSLLDRLNQMCQKTVDEFQTNIPLRNSFRYHDLDWAAEGMELTRPDLNWISKVYLDNEDEYKFAQFSISTGQGRVIGFMDEFDVFNVVLLDPNHNAQPSERNNHQIRPCSPLENQYEHLLKKAEDLVAFGGNRCSVSNCEVKNRIEDLVQPSSEFGVLHVKAETYYKALQFVINGKMPSVEGILELGIMQCDEDASGGALPQSVA